MSHRPLAFAGAVALALLLAAPALAIRVHVRVEGPKTTIFGATEPRLTPVGGVFAPPDGAPVTVGAATPLGALERASRLGEFYYRLQTTGFGPYVDRIGRVVSSGTSGWVYKVNNVSPPIGADQYELREGDRVLWYYATFGPAGGPRTLEVGLAFTIIDCVDAPCAQPPPCAVARSFDDQGQPAAARPVVFLLDGRRLASRSGRLCLPRHWHDVRATMAGAVRSRVVIAPRRFRRAGSGAAAALAGRPA